MRENFEERLRIPGECPVQEFTSRRFKRVHLEIEQMPLKGTRIARGGENKRKLSKKQDRSGDTFESTDYSDEVPLYL